MNFIWKNRTHVLSYPNVSRRCLERLPNRRRAIGGAVGVPTPQIRSGAGEVGDELQAIIVMAKTTKVFLLAIH
jgi:hypothetical protein